MTATEDAKTATVARKRHQFTTRQYDQMIAAGIFDEGPRVELLGGEIIEMAAMCVRHATGLARFNRVLRKQITDDLDVGVQTPILLDDLSEPEPDLFVYRLLGQKTLLTPADLILVVEIADHSLSYDRDHKFPRYAAAGIPEAWLLDLPNKILERHGDPYAGRYRHVATARTGATLDSLALPGLTIAVDYLLTESW